jgi:opacity protein-like surface antigen
MDRPPVITRSSLEARMLEAIKKPITTFRYVVAIALTLSAMNAQVAAGQADARGRAGSSVSVTATLMRPLGALGANIGSGYGVSGAFLLPLDRRGLLSLRADLGLSEYGHETKRTPFSETVGGRVEVDVRTTHSVVPGSIGLQLTPSLGPVEPYVNAGVGGQAFFTDSSVDPHGVGSLLASTTNHSDFAFAWSFGGGIYVPFTSALPNVQIDLGVQYYRGSRAEYLAPGSIVDLPDGEIAITPMASSTRLLTLRFGARIGL